MSSHVIITLGAHIYPFRLFIAKCMGRTVRTANGLHLLSMPLLSEMPLFLRNCGYRIFTTQLVKHCIVCDADKRVLFSFLQFIAAHKAMEPLFIQMFQQDLCVIDREIIHGVSAQMLP